MKRIPENDKINVTCNGSLKIRLLEIIIIITYNNIFIIIITYLSRITASVLENNCYRKFVVRRSRNSNRAFGTSPSSVLTRFVTEATS